MLSALMNDPNVSFLHVSNTCYSISKAMPKVAPSSGFFFGEKSLLKNVCINQCGSELIDSQGSISLHFPFSYNMGDHTLGLKRLDGSCHF